MIIILNRPQMAENVGFSARAMANFSFCELRIVSPGKIMENEWNAKEHNENFNLQNFMQKAEAVAKGGSKIIQNAKIFETLEEAIKDINKVYALTARRREIIKEVITIKSFADEILLQSESKIAALFGAEASGLSNQDVSFCHKIVEIEASTDYSSINLGMSVGILCHALFSNKNKQAFKLGERGIKNQVKLQEMNYMLKFLEEKLENANYFKVPEKKEGMMINIRNTFTKNTFSESEIRTLIGIFDLIKKG